MTPQPLRIAINGFGRIGRVFTRIVWDNPACEIVAINSLSKADLYAHLLKYDSIYGPWNHELSYEGDEALLIDGKRIPLYHEKDVLNVPWKKHEVDVVIESTGVFRSRAASEAHLVAGAKYVVITAPAKDEDATFVYGINHETFDPEHHKIISAASCTTTCLAPIVKILSDTIGIKHGNVLTTHAYTNDQHLVDHPHRSDDYRRSRAAATSIIPTETGAAKTIGKIIPELNGKLDGMALRVPVPVVSVTHLVAESERTTTVEEVNMLFARFAKEKYSKSFQVSSLPLVSVDHIGTPYGSVLDALSTQVVGGTQVSVIAWYDNEWGYVNQMRYLVEYLGERIKQQLVPSVKVRVSTAV